jgi:lysophospholipase L1-like esterase
MARKKRKAGASARAKGTRWVSAAGGRFEVRGLAWFAENERRFIRLPLRAEGVVADKVWQKSLMPASVRIAFRSDTTRLAVRATYPDAGTRGPAGACGFTLFCGPPGRMRYWAVAKPVLPSESFEGTFFEGVPKKLREFRVYLPLRTPVEDVELGLSPGARILKASPPAFKRPIVFYGTSITQGGSAGTSASNFVSVAGRMLNADVVNLGFGGCGRGEPEVARLVVEIDAALFVVDYAANVDVRRLDRTLPEFVRILRDAHPRTPVVIMTNIPAPGYDFSAATRDVLEGRRDVMMEFYCKARSRGDRNVHLVDGFGLVPYGTDAAHVDTVHPSDLGYRMMAERLCPQLEQVLARDN